MTEALQIASAVIASVGTSGAIVVGLSRYLGDLWMRRALHQLQTDHDFKMQESQRQVDERLKRLDAILQHQGLVLGRLATFELEALVECWRAARKCLPLINSPRAVNSGTDLDDLNRHSNALVTGQNELLDAIGRHEPFLPNHIAGVLEAIRQTAALELLQIHHNTPFQRAWWENGMKNQEKIRALTDELRAEVQKRIAELRVTGEAPQSI